MEGGYMRIAGVIGDPVGHSLSPVMHNAAFEALGIDARYELWQTSLDELPARVDSLRREGVLGANVTVPHKGAVMPHLDDVSETARLIGAVNTIVSRDGRLSGDNTDAYGFRRSIELAYPDAVGHAVILGAGGASRAVVVALRQMNVASITIANRTASRAEALAEEFGIRVLRWDAVVEEAFPDAGIVVNATALGWHDEVPIPLESLRRLPEGALVVDLTYRETPILREARSRGLRALDGLGMLVHQGARSFELWTGQEAPVDVMQDAVVREQARRA
jgi:shikimate dehydrogenase